MKTLLDNIEIQSEYIGNAVWRPFGSHRSDKWEVWLYRGEAKISFDFYLGEGNNGREPELKEVIYALLSDSYAGSISFEDFCSEFGYDTDSRRAYTTWERCGVNARKLRVLFTPEEIADLEEDFFNY